MPSKRSFAQLTLVLPFRSPRRKFIPSSLIPALLACLSAMAGAQATTSVRGTITDQNGAAVAGATVAIANSESRTERATVTGGQGEYQFLLIPPGTYTLTVKASGFRNHEEKGLALLVNTPATANVQLKVGAANEVITVTSEIPAINLVDASIGNSFDERQVRQIPLEGRNVPDLLSLQAGVTFTGRVVDDDPSLKDQDTRNGAVNGARSDQSNVTLDGIDVNDQSNGYAFKSVLPVTQDSVEEFRVTTTNYGADQGQGSGAQVALVTKGGTNKLHGSAYEYIRNTITSANDYLVKQSQLSIGLPNKPLRLNRNIFGVTVGGPLHKDRAFFFLNYEGTRKREETRALRIIPTPQMCQGIFRYVNGDGSGITTWNEAQLALLDPNQSIGPYHPNPGIDPAMLDTINHTGYLDKTFCTGKTVTNDLFAGDGLNYAGYVFRAPTKDDNDAVIARLDYRITSDGKHSLFWRGALQDVRNPLEPFLPRDAPEQTIADHSKGFAFGLTSILSPTLTNSFRWGFTRQSFGIVGNSDDQWNQFLGLDEGYVFSRNLQVPLHNLVDDVSWTKGTHNFQFGALVGIARNPRASYLHSNTIALGTTNWTSPIGFAGTYSTLDPTNTTGHPGISGPEPLSSTQYDRPLVAMFGMISDVVANYNLDKSGIPQAQGAPVNRRYGLDWYEFYGQDTWRVKPNLTVTYGLRWSFFPAPWETNGFQTYPTFGLGTQFNKNVKNMNQGIGYGAMPPIEFNLGRGPGFYSLEKTDLSPRISIAYSPRPTGGVLKTLFGENDKTVLRLGLSRVYDRAGFALLNSFDQTGAAGLSTTIQNACCTFGVTSAEDLPRITGIHNIPQTNVNGVQFLLPYVTPNPPWPQTPSTTAQANLWGVDDTLKTPHAYSLDFSIGRELPNRFSVQVSYVGRLGRRLLTQRDLTQPLDIVDPKTGIDYYQAASALSTLARKFASQNGSLPNYYLSSITPAQISTITAANLDKSQYWIDMLPPLRSGASYYTDTFGTGFQPSQNPADSLVQEVFNLFYNPLLSVIGDEIVGIADIDNYGGLGDNIGSGSYYFANSPGQFLNNQAFSMYGWSSIGNSSYHALQATLRKQMSHGVQFDLNYTYSRSLDITSAASRVGFAVYGYTNVGLVGTRLANAFSPRLARAPSDFDLTHQINFTWVADLPFGKGRAFGSQASGAMEAIIGNWQLSGIARWTSGFPFSVDAGQRWPTDWFLTAIAQMTTRPKTCRCKGNGTVNVFADPAAAQQSFTLPLPGQVGSRNVLRGDGYAGLDMSLAKSWNMPFNEAQRLQFRWEVFNVPNLTRFNAQSVGSASTLTSLTQSPDGFGAYSSLLTQPRVMQFALRYEF
jgi:hypothetical protein